MTSEGSKGSRGEKQMEGDTDLSWDHEGLDTPPKPGKIEPSESFKPPRSPKISKDPKVKGKYQVMLANECPRCKKNHGEGECQEVQAKESKKEVIASQDEKQTPKVDRKSYGNSEKWDFGKIESHIDKEIARWIEEQNEFKRKRDYS